MKRLMDKIAFIASLIYAFTLFLLYLKERYGYKPKHKRYDYMLSNGCLSSGHKYWEYGMCKICGEYKKGV